MAVEYEEIIWALRCLQSCQQKLAMPGAQTVLSENGLSQKGYGFLLRIFYQMIFVLDERGKLRGVYYPKLFAADGVFIYYSRYVGDDRPEDGSAHLDDHCLALSEDWQAMAFGAEGDGQCTVPALPAEGKYIRAAAEG